MKGGQCSFGRRVGGKVGYAQSSKDGGYSDKGTPRRSSEERREEEGVEIVLG